jgi:proline iminopeptidase
METLVARRGPDQNEAVKALQISSVCVLLAGCVPSDRPADVSQSTVQVRDTVLAAVGIRLHVRLLGNGPDTVVVPLTYWNQDGFRGIAAGRTFVFYDPRGRRESTPVTDEDGFGIDRDLEDLEFVRTALGISRMALIGSSYYGALVARYAMLYPERVTRLVLVGALYPRRDPFFDMEVPVEPATVPPAAIRLLDSMRAVGADTLQPETFCRAYWAVEAPGTVGDPEAAAQRTYPCHLANELPANLSVWTRGVFQSLGQWDWTDDAPAAAMPALVIHGTLDRMVPYASSEEWARLLPDAWLLTLDGAGHVPWWEFADVLFPMLDEFLSGRVPAGARRAGSGDGAGSARSGPSG